jgi:hypothetical protein
VGFGLVTTFIGHFQLLITIPYVTFANSYTLQFTSGRTESPRSAVSSQVLWYRLPTADDSLFLDSRTAPVPQPQQHLTYAELHWNSTPIVISSISIMGYRFQSSLQLNLFEVVDFATDGQSAISWCRALLCDNCLILHVGRPL